MSAESPEERTMVCSLDGNLCSVEKGSSRWSRKSYHGKDTSNRYTLYTVHNHHTHLQPTPGQLSSLSLSPLVVCVAHSPPPKKTPTKKREKKKNFWNWRPLPKHGVCPFVPSPPAWIFPSFLLSLSLSVRVFCLAFSSASFFFPIDSTYPSNPTGLVGRLFFLPASVPSSHGTCGAP